jgi:uncharacterized protein YlxW (UPF0749 family)
MVLSWGMFSTYADELIVKKHVVNDEEFDLTSKRADLLKELKKLKAENKALQSKIFVMANQISTLKKKREIKWTVIDRKDPKGKHKKAKR